MPINFYWDKEGCHVTKVESQGLCTSFSLSDGTGFKIGIPLDELERLVKMDLVNNFVNVNLSVFLDKFEMTANQWKVISCVLRQSEEITKAFAGYPKLQKLIELPYEKLHKLPTLLYGGYIRGLYLSYPLNFTRMPRSKFYSNLFSDNEYLVTVRLDEKYNITEVRNETISPSHYLGDYFV
ncbi:hypothetical protein UABAM_03701 [Candidatus Uabimicrobium amorphum]|uniref:Uncharacterized protein n=2 Tax=Uabimicrobium amorphum TaxID=2596890 RepID=A0A5S9IRG4_UABAM|nr:hypothetical protein UABAM_03701 [Candidatus Uabimicrobium amorphum]